MSARRRSSPTAQRARAAAGRHFQQLMSDWFTLTFIQDRQKLAGPITPTLLNWLFLAVIGVIIYASGFTLTIAATIGGWLLITLLRSAYVQRRRRTQVAGIFESLAPAAKWPSGTATRPAVPSNHIKKIRWGAGALPEQFSVTLNSASPAAVAPLLRGAFEVIVEGLPHSKSKQGGEWLFTWNKSTLTATAVDHTDPRLVRKLYERRITALIAQNFAVRMTATAATGWSVEVKDWAQAESATGETVDYPTGISVRCADRDLTDPALRDKVERLTERAIPVPGEWLFTWDASASMLSVDHTDKDSLEAQRKRTQRRMSDDINALSPSRGKDPVILEVTGWVSDDMALPRDLHVTFGTLALDDPRKQDQIEDGFDAAVANRWPEARALFEWHHGAITELDITLVAKDDPRALRRSALTRFRNVTNAKFGSARNPVTTEVLDWQDALSRNGTALPDRARVHFGTVDVTKPETRDAFQDHWDSIDDSNDWHYRWNAPEGFVEMKSVPLLAKAIAFPNPDDELHERWNNMFRDGKIVLGPQKGGGEFVWDLSKVPHGLIGGRTGAGKAAACSEPILTGDGWRTLGDLTVGDRVFDENGQLCDVTGVFDQPLSDTCFKVTFSDGSIVVASDDHLWWTEDRAARNSAGAARRNEPSRDRKPWLPDNIVDRIRVEADSARPDDVISIPEVAALADVHPSTKSLFRLAQSIGPARERREEHRTYVYRAQKVTQVQKVAVYSASELSDWIVSKVRSPRFASTRMSQHGDALLALSAHYRDRDTVTAHDLAAGLGMPAKPVRAWLADANTAVHNSIEKRPVTLDIPAKTIVRSGPSVALYPKQALLTMVADYGAKPMYDQRELHTLGQVRTTCEIRHSLHTESGHANHSVPVCMPLQYPEASLPIAPYTLGAWLGDGSSWHSEITSMDIEIIARIERDGYSVTERPLTPSETAKAGKARRYGIGGLRAQLLKANLLTTASSRCTKHIPADYLAAAEHQRRAVLAGLLDTDGTVSGSGQVEFSNSNETLARDVLELARGLGYRATLRSKAATLEGRTCGTTWTISFTTHDEVFGLPRKQRTHTARTATSGSQRTSNRYIVDVQRVPPVPMRCISVDSPTRQFLIGEALIPTHNSVQLDILLYYILFNRDMSDIIVCDPKMTDFTWTPEFPNVLRFAAGPREICEAIAFVHAEMERRQQLLNRRGVRNMRYLRGHYREHPEHETEDGPAPKRLFLLFDEIANFLSSSADKELEEAKNQARSQLEQIGQLSRAMEINMIVAAQKPEAKYVSTQLKQMMELRVCVGPVDEYTSKQILESTHGTRFGEGTPKGRAWSWTSEQGFRVVQVPYLPSATEPAPWDPSITIEGSQDRIRAKLKAEGWTQILVPNADGGQDPRWVTVEDGSEGKERDDKPAAEPTARLVPENFPADAGDEYLVDDELAEDVPHSQDSPFGTGEEVWDDPPWDTDENTYESA